MADKRKKPLLVLLDGHGIIHRAYHAVKEPLTVRQTGEVVTAVYGFANTLLSVLQELQPTHLAVALDKGKITFRHEQDPSYKVHRPETPEDLRAQIGRCRELIEAFGIPIYELEGYEADDMLGTLARQAAEQGIETYLVSLDSDIAQLVQPGVHLYMYRPYQRDSVIYETPEDVRQRYGVWPRQMADLKGLKGDASDNIPGVPGVGDKTAVKLIEQFGDVESVLEHVDEVQPQRLQETLRANKEQALMSKQLATIVTDAPVTLDLDACNFETYDRQRVLDLFRELEFRSLLSRLPDAGPAGVEEQKPSASDEAEVHYHLVLTEKNLEELTQRLRQAKSFAFDTETTDIDAMRARLVGLAVALRPAEAYYIPVGHNQASDRLSLETVLQRVGPFFEDEAIQKVAHNGKYDVMVMANEGVQTSNLGFDTMIAAYLLGEGALSLKWLASKHLGVEMTPITDLIGKGAQQLSMADVDVEAAGRYACADADMTGRLRTLMEEELKRQDLMALFQEVEMPLVPVLARMETVGVALEVAVLREMSQTLAAKTAEVEEEVYREVGHRFNIGSPRPSSSARCSSRSLGCPRPARRSWDTPPMPGPWKACAASTPSSIWCKSTAS